MRTETQITELASEGLTVTDLRQYVDDLAYHVTVEGPKGYKTLYYPVPGASAMKSRSLSPEISHAKQEHFRARKIAEIVLARILRDQDITLDKFNGEHCYIKPPSDHAGGKKGAREILRNTLDM